MSTVPLAKHLDEALKDVPPSKVALFAACGALGSFLIFDTCFRRDSVINFVKTSFLKTFRTVEAPFGFVAAQVNEAAKDITFPSTKKAPRFREIPAAGLSDGQVLSLSTAHHDQLDQKLGDTKLSGVVYFGTKTNTDLIAAVVKEHLWANPLFADYFGATRKMEAEIVEMMVSLFNGSTRSGQCGAYCFGGTESILMAMLAYRNQAMAAGNHNPNVVIPVTCHPAFDKASMYFKIRLIKVPVDPVTHRVNPATMRSYITSETVAIVGNAPQFAHGSIDPIKELSDLALEHKIGLHVDACLGGFLIQFFEKAGMENAPVIDFRHKGVTTISCDIHKWGGAPKGASCVMYRSQELRKHQTFRFADYPGGLYVTACINGSKPGFVIAAAWATLLSNGQSRYIENARMIIDATKKFADAVGKMEGLRMLGCPDVSTVGFTSDLIDIYAFMKELKDLGWLFNPVQFPAGIHLGITLEHTVPGVLDDLIAAMHRVLGPMVEEAKAKQRAGTLGTQKHDSLVYGSTQAIPDRSIIADVLAKYVDNYYVNCGAEEEEERTASA